MKKSLIAIAALFTLTLMSCKKDYVCECSITRTSTSGSTTKDDGSYTFNDSRSRAETRCTDQEKTGTDIIGDYSRDCQIK